MKREPLRVNSCGRRISIHNHIARSYGITDRDKLLVDTIDGPRELGHGWIIAHAEELVPTVPFGTVVREWYRMDDPSHPAPKDGRKVDLLYPEPRGRTINCFWDGKRWGWYSPTWHRGHAMGGQIEFFLLPENQWDYAGYPNMEPTHWMATPGMPSS